MSMKVLACCFMTDIAFNPKGQIDEEIPWVMSFLCRYFISDGHEVDINFILQIFIDEHELVPIAKGIDSEEVQRFNTHVTEANEEDYEMN